MRAIRRAVVAIVLGVLGGVVIRLRGTRDTPELVGGWRPLRDDDLR
ncbi:MAG: hypothetical protein R2698_04790 [Microthrixaceae bacterium]